MGYADDIPLAPTPADAPLPDASIEARRKRRFRRLVELGRRRRAYRLSAVEHQQRRQRGREEKKQQTAAAAPRTAAPRRRAASASKPAKSDDAAAAAATAAARRAARRAVCSRRSHRFYRLRRRAGAFLGQVAEGVTSVVGGVAVACVRAAAAVAGAVGYAAPLLRRLATRLQEAVSRRLPPPPLPRTDLGGSCCAGAAK